MRLLPKVAPRVVMRGQTAHQGFAGSVWLMESLMPQQAASLASPYSSAKGQFVIKRPGEDYQSARHSGNVLLSEVEVRQLPGDQ